jgi:hypothetical protein
MTFPCTLKLAPGETQEYTSSHPERGGALAANTPPQMWRGGAPSAGVVLNGWGGERTTPQIHNRFKSPALSEARGRHILA